ncbi:hypothetical protein T5B8_08343 [Salinisphaera sp. T5B8]
MVRLFKALTSEDSLLPSFEFVSAAEYTDGSKQESDVPWIESFSADGGQVVISGDVAMHARPHERKAYRDAGLIVFFFASKWGNMKLFPRSAMLLRWWPRIEEQIAKSSPKQCWQIPVTWNGEEMREVTGPDD